MSRRQKTKGEKLPPFVPLELLMLESAAYRDLSGNAAKLLPFFIRSCVRARKGKPDISTPFGFTYTEAGKDGFSTRLFSRAMKELVAHRFIELVETGGLRGAGHSNSKYRLSIGWLTWGGLGGRSVP